MEKKLIDKLQVRNVVFGVALQLFKPWSKNLRLVDEEDIEESVKN